MMPYHNVALGVCSHTTAEDPSVRQRKTTTALQSTLTTDALWDIIILILHYNCSISFKNSRQLSKSILY